MDNVTEAQPEATTHLPRLRAEAVECYLGHVAALHWVHCETGRSVLVTLAIGGAGDHSSSCSRRLA